MPLIHKGWGTKPAYNKRTRAEVQCIYCGETNIHKLIKDTRRSFGVSSTCRACYAKRYGKNTPQRKAYNHTKDMKQRNSMGRRSVYAYEVLFDPSETYPRGALFQLQDFNVSLAGSVWPTGLMVRDINTAQCSSVWIDQLVGIPDRDWHQYRMEKVDERNKDILRA